MAEVTYTVRQLGANSATLEASVFAATDVITYSTLLAALKVFAAAQTHKITNLTGSQLFTFLAKTYATDAAALTAFAKAGGLLTIAASAASTTALPVLKVSQATLTALVASTGTGATPVIRIAFAASIDA